MNSSQFNSPQMEFGFAETVTSKRRKGRARRSSAQWRAEKLSKTEGGMLESPLCAPAGGTDQLAKRIDWTEEPGVFGDEWIKGVCGNIRSARDMREAVKLTACYLTDLIDREIDMRGHNGAWKEEYEAYCWTHYFRLTIETETELEELRALWWMSAIILNTESGANDRSDWELFEDLCDYGPDSSNLDGNEAEASFIEFLATYLSNLHLHLFRAGDGTSNERQ